MNINKIAQNDAFDWARAEMFFGEGAGTRRKLLYAEILDKQAKIPGYYEAFIKAYQKQDMGEHAIKAAQERKRIDRAVKVRRNVNAAYRGDRRNMTPVLGIAATAAIIAHQTGYDKVLLEKGRRQYKQLKARYAAWKLQRKPKDG